MFFCSRNVRAVAGMAVLCVTAGQAQDYPGRLIMIVAAYSGGALTDQVGRILQPKLQASLGQSVIVKSLDSCPALNDCLVAYIEQGATTLATLLPQAETA